MACVATGDLDGAIAEIERCAALGFRAFSGAAINYVAHSLAPTIEPVVELCASGVLERFPGIRFATIKAGIR